MFTENTHSGPCFLSSMKRTHAHRRFQYISSRSLPNLLPGHGSSITTYLHSGSSSYGGALFSLGGIEKVVVRNLGLGCMGEVKAMLLVVLQRLQGR